MPIIPMSQAEDFKPIPAGTYEADLDEWDYEEESAASGEPYIKFTYVITDGEYEGRKLFRNRSCQVKSLGYLKRDLITLGADPEDISKDFDPEDVMPDLVGNSCRIVVSIRKYEDEDQNDIKRILKPSD